MIGSCSMKYESETIFHYTAHKKLWIAIAKSGLNKYEVLSCGKYYGLSDDEILLLTSNENICFACEYADAVLEEEKYKETLFHTCDFCPLAIDKDMNQDSCLGGLYHDFATAKEILDSIYAHLFYCDYYTFKTEQEKLDYYEKTVNIYKSELKNNLLNFKLEEADFIEEINKLKSKVDTTIEHDNIIIGKLIEMVLKNQLIYPLRIFIKEKALEIANLPVREGVCYD